MTATSLDSTHRGQTLPASLLAIGLALGLGGDLLIGELITPGPGLALWMALFGMSACWLAHNYQSPHLPVIGGWSLVSFAAALMLVFRTLPIIEVLMLLVMLVAAAMVLMELGGKSLKQSVLSDHIAAGLRVPLQAISGAVPVIGSMEFREHARHPRHLALFRGLLIALPLLVVFGSLFSQADMRFDALTSAFLSIFSPELPGHVVITLLFFWLATGLLSGIYRQPSSVSAPGGPRFTLGAEETGMVMGTLVLLFITFVLLQIPYLFGGRETIVATEGLTLADYARRGFFELVVVAGLTLCILLVMARVSRAPHLLRPLATVLLACVLLILASALQRLLLYTEAFGLTLDRITALTFLAWFAICLVLFGLIILRGQTEGFAMGMTCSAVAIAFCFALANPAAIVIRFNTSMERSDGEISDYLYFRQLGSRAVPVLLANIDKLSDEQQCALSTDWLQALEGNGSLRHIVSGGDDWRTWNLSKFRAREALETGRDRLIEVQSQACPFILPNLGRVNVMPSRIFVAQ